MDAATASSICRALSDANRIRIVQFLTGGELCACQLLEHFQFTQPTLSHHMKILAECNLVNSRREWKNTYYSLNCETLTAFREFIGALNCNKSAGAEDSCCSCEKGNTHET